MRCATPGWAINMAFSALNGQQAQAVFAGAAARAATLGLIALQSFLHWSKFFCVGSNSTEMQEQLGISGDALQELLHKNIG